MGMGIKFSIGAIVKVKGFSGLYQVVSFYYESFLIDEDDNEDDEESYEVIEEMYYTLRSIDDKNYVIDGSEDDMDYADQSSKKESRGVSSSISKKEVDFILDNYIQAMSMHQLISKVTPDDNEYQERADKLIEFLKNRVIK